MIYFGTSLFGSLVLLLGVAAATQCKAVPSSDNWPSQEDWAQLNADLGGRLLAPSPPALACDTTNPSTYNQAECSVAGNNWFNESFHTQDPVSVHWPNWQKDACLPTAVYNKTTGCDVTLFAKYVVDATDVSHVVTAIKFASAHNVRLGVKGTGHDFLGRSSFPGLSIWTRNIRGINVLSSFVPNGCQDCAPVSAVTVNSGHLVCEIYAETKKYNVIPVIGACPGVGLGGFLTGGGHSPISVKYGLAVDNALEVTLVTPDGQVVTANHYQHQDLFWATKGGGGSTFGVLISATLRTFPVYPVTKIQIQFSSSQQEASQNNNTDFYSTLAYFHTQIPKFTDNYFTGYYQWEPIGSASPQAERGILPRPTTQDNAASDQLEFKYWGWANNVSQDKVDELLSDFKNKLAVTTGLDHSITLSPQDTVYNMIQSCDIHGTSAGYNTIWGSRLWDKKAVTDEKGLIKTFRALNPPAAKGRMVAGPGVRQPSKLKTTSVTPAWRKTYLLIHVELYPDYKNPVNLKQEAHQLTYKQTAALRNLAPKMGSYLNEADANEPNFQQAFWGSNYKALLFLKRKYDPKGVFWCAVCVGAEDWTLNTKTGEVCNKR